MDEQYVHFEAQGFMWFENHGQIYKELVSKFENLTVKQVRRKLQADNKNCFKMGMYQLIDRVAFKLESNNGFLKSIKLDKTVYVYLRQNQPKLLLVMIYENNKLVNEGVFTYKTSVDGIIASFNTKKTDYEFKLYDFSNNLLLNNTFREMSFFYLPQERIYKLYLSPRIEITSE